MDQLTGWGLLALIVAGVVGTTYLQRGGGGSLGGLGAPRMSPKASRFVQGKIRKLMHEGYGQRQAVATAFSMARTKGYRVPAAPGA